MAQSLDLLPALAVISPAARALLFKIAVLEKRRPSAIGVLDAIASQLLREAVPRTRSLPRARRPVKVQG